MSDQAHKEFVEFDFAEDALAENVEDAALDSFGTHDPETVLNEKEVQSALWALFTAAHNIIKYGPNSDPDALRKYLEMFLTTGLGIQNGELWEEIYDPS